MTTPDTVAPPPALTPGLLVLLSGGLDSTTLLYLCSTLGPVHALSVDYGQRHRKELDCARQITSTLGIRHTVLPMDWLGGEVASALTTDAQPVPDGHYAWATMRQTVVPNRNMILLALAAGIATSRGLGGVACAVHAGDHAIYPDCRPEFLQAMQAALTAGLDGIGDCVLYTPFLWRTKAEIAAEAALLGVPVEATWSCYKGRDVHCGRCGTCVERREALALARVFDPTEYADPDYWRTVTTAPTLSPR